MAMRLFILMMAPGSCIAAQSQTAPPDSVLVRLSTLKARTFNNGAVVAMISVNLNKGVT